MSSYAFINSADEDYIIMKYRIKNTNAAAVSNFMRGLLLTGISDKRRPE